MINPATSMTAETPIAKKIVDEIISISTT